VVSAKTRSIIWAGTFRYSTVSKEKVAVKRRLEGGAEMIAVAKKPHTVTPTGKLMLNLMGSIAEFERELMLERQREGIARAKAQGAYKGRAPTARKKAAAIVRLKAEGKRAEEIAEILKVSRASVFRILKERAA
jgi:DNA invertase Pin-like site-specific DNA recombinase